MHSFFRKNCDLSEQTVGVTSNQLQKPSDSRKKFLKLKKLKIRQNSEMVETENFYKLGPKICTPPTPIFWREILSNPRLRNMVRVISKLVMDPSNVNTSDPQLWLLALICCKIGIFWCFVFFSNEIWFKPQRNYTNPKSKIATDCLTNLSENKDYHRGLKNNISKPQRVEIKYR